MRLAVTLVALLAAIPAHAARRHPMTLQSLIAECGKDMRNPVVFTCPAGCTITVFNGMNGQGPQFALSPACRALK